MSLKDLADIIALKTHSFRLSTADGQRYPFLVAVCKETGTETPFKFMQQQYNFVLAQSISTRFPSLSLKHITCDDVHLDDCNKQKVALYNNTAEQDLRIILNHFRENPPATAFPVAEYCKAFKAPSNSDYDHIIQVELPYFDQKFESFGALYLGNLDGTPIEGDAEMLSRLYTQGSLVSAQCRLRFESFDNGDRLAMRLYVVCGKLVRKAEKRLPKLDEVDFAAEL